MNRLLIAMLISMPSMLALGEASPVITSQTTGQNPPQSAPQRSAARDEVALLAQLSARSKSIQSLQGHFTQQKHIAVLPAPLNSTGQFHFEQGKNVVWETLTPVHNSVHLTPKGISFDDDQHQLQGAPNQQAGVEVVAKIFMGVIAGELDSLNDYFTINALGDSSHWTLQLTPRSANLAAYIKGIELQGGELTEQLDIAETNGDTTHINFTTDKVVRKVN